MGWDGMGWRSASGAPEEVAGMAIVCYVQGCVCLCMCWRGEGTWDPGR